MTIEIQESGDLVGEPEGRVWLAKLIASDVHGSSGFYPASVLKQAAVDHIFVAGTPSDLDHPTAEEKVNRPIGSVQNFVGELAEDAFYDENGPEGPGLYGKLRIFSDAIEFVKERARNIGVSIRADGLKGDDDKFYKITSAKSVDLVRRAGAGGKLVAAIESATTLDSAESADEHETKEETLDKEALDALTTTLTTAISEGFTKLEESLKPADPIETVDDADKVDAVEAATVLAASGLSADGIRRVADLHKATGTALVDLIESEKSYVASVAEEAAVDDAVTVVDDTSTSEITESAEDSKPITLGIWK